MNAAIFRAITVMVLAVSIVSQGPIAHAATPSAVRPDDLNLGAAQQVVIVTAPSWRSRTGTVTAFERQGRGPWEQAFGPIPAMLGHSGLVPAKDRRQGTGKTPTGTFRVVSAFGRKPNPGTSMKYRQIDRNDAWTYHPKYPSTYNMMQTADRSWRSYGGYVEHLWSYGVQYDYVAVLDYNLPAGPISKDASGIRRTSKAADTSRGGGIFLHASNGTVTAGCIAIPVDRMRELTRWLDPAKDPHIVIRLDP